MSFVDSISNYVIYPFEKVRRPIPDREKNFNIFVFVSIALMLAEIPLVGGIRTVEQTQATFRVSGTLMQLGTHPFVFASMLSPLVLNKKDDKKKDYENLIGLFLSVIMAFQWAYNNDSWFGGIELCGIAWVLMHAEIYLEERGSISPSTALIFANGSMRLLMSIYADPISFVWTAVIFAFVVWIETLFVTLPLTHMKYRSDTTSMPIPVMYNSTTSLIMYYTLIEGVATAYAPASVLMAKSTNDLMIAAPVFFLSVWFINKKLPSFNKQTAKDLVKNWREQKYTMKGWRDQSRMYKFVQNILDRNIYWNTIFICGLWLCTNFYPTSLSVSTLFIMASVIKRPKFQLF